MNVQSFNRRMSNAQKNGLIAVAATEIFFGVCSIGCSIATIIYTKDYYRECYYYSKFCIIYLWLLRFSLSAQGIWTGCMVIISASINVRFAKQPSRLMGNVSGGFSILSFILVCIMLIMECFPVSEEYAIYSSTGYYNGYYYDYYSPQLAVIWALHCALLCYAAVMFVLTMTNMIISYQIVGCCVTQTVNPPIGNAYSIPMQNHQRGYVPNQLTTNMFQGGYIGPQLEGQQQAMSLQQQPIPFSLPHQVHTSPINHQIGSALIQEAPTSMMQQYYKQQAVQNTSMVNSLPPQVHARPMNPAVEPNATTSLPPVYHIPAPQTNSSQQIGRVVEESTGNAPVGSADAAVN